MGSFLRKLIQNIYQDFFGIIWLAFWAEEYSCLENKQTDRERGEYRQGARPQQDSPSTHKETAPHPQERKSHAVIQVYSNRLSLKGTNHRSDCLLQVAAFSKVTDKQSCIWHTRENKVQGCNSSCKRWGWNGVKNLKFVQQQNWPYVTHNNCR